MLDDLRQQAEKTNIDEFDKLSTTTDEYAPQNKLRFSLPSFGLTPQQRFFIALLLLIVIFLISSLVLLVTGKIAIPL